MKKMYIWSKKLGQKKNKQEISEKMKKLTGEIINSLTKLLKWLSRHLKKNSHLKIL